MPVSILWTTVGFVVGVAATAFALEVAFRGVRNEERASLTKDWTLAELSRDGPPDIVTTSLDGVDVPENSRVLVAPGAKLPSKIQHSCQIRVHEDAEGNFAIGSGRAVLCTGAVEPGTLALETVHPALVDRLETSFESLWMQAKPFKKTVKPSQIPSHEGNQVQVEGQVTEILSSGDKALLDIETPDDSGGHGRVCVPASTPIEEGSWYKFDGEVVTEGGRQVVKAQSFRELERATV
jgi:hypothetical protein